MLEFAKMIHEAIGIQSPRAFIALFAFFGLLLFGFVGWAIDKGYRVKLLEEAKKNHPKEESPVEKPENKSVPLDSHLSKQVKKTKPTPPQKAQSQPEIHIEQHSEGANSPNIIAGQVTIMTDRDDAPRSIPPNKRAMIVDFLRPGNRHSLRLLFFNRPNTKKYANEIAGCFVEAGWKLNVYSFDSGSPAYRGLLYDVGSSSEGSKTMELIAPALSALGAVRNPSMYTGPIGSPPVSQFDVALFVGLSPTSN